jgi:CheY-like chemotaxis protein
MAGQEVQSLQGGCVVSAPAIGSPGVKPGLRVLIVDDNVDSVTAMSMLLEVDGYDVRVAHEALAALEIVAQFEPEVILLDLGLPGMNGLELARALRKLPVAANALLIAVTGYGQPSDRQRSQDAGFNHHLVKPVSSGEIVRVIASHFST